MQSAIVNWSGGKDSCLALYEARKAGLQIESLMTTMQVQQGDLPNRVSHHEIPESLLDVQAAALGLPIHKVILPDQPTDGEYESIMKDAMEVWSSRGIRDSIFGDIFLEDLKQFREQKLASIGWTAQFPLWKRDTPDMARQFIDLGFRAVVVSVDGQKLGPDFCGRPYDLEFLRDLPDEVDPCGEYGEFHTFVFDGPGFYKSVPWKQGVTYSRTYQWQQKDFIYHYSPAVLDDDPAHLN